MVLRKPYAFLIKNFKVIHAIITFLLGVIAYRYAQILDFFRDYVFNNYKTSVVLNLDKVYTPSYLYLSVIIVIGLVIAILILLNHKKKPNKLYIFMSIYYILIFFGLFYLTGVFASFEKALLASTISRRIRDILIIIYAPQFVFIIFTLLRAIGFNVKNFNFANDLRELNYSYSDQEEFELNINFDSSKLKRKTHRSYRELIYYVKENKFIVTCIGIICGILFIVYVVNNIHTNYNKTYGNKETFVFNNLNITVNESMITNLDYMGNVLDSYYLVVNFNIKNDSGKSVLMDYNNFKLEIGNKLLNPTNTQIGYFIDYSYNIIPKSISHRADKTFGLVYKIDASDKNKRMKLNIYNGTVYEDDEYLIRKIFVKLNPKEYSNVKLAGNYKLGEKVSFEDTFLEQSSLTVNSYQFDKRYLFKYNKCDATGKCKDYDDIITIPAGNNRFGNILLIMDVSYIQQSNTDYSMGYNNIKDFVDNFVTIQYKTDEKKASKFINATPDYVDNLLVIELPQEAQDANVLQLVVNIRNKKYIINLKS